MSETDLRARARKTADLIIDRLLEKAGFAVIPTVEREHAAGVVAEALAEQIASTVSDEMIAAGERVLWTYGDEVEKRSPEETADFLTRLFRAMADASAAAGEKK